MKNLIGCVLIFLLGVGATLGFLAWRENVEDRSRQSAPALDLEAAVELRQALLERVEGEPRRDGVARIKLSEVDLRALAIAELARQPRGNDIALVVREVLVELEADSVEVGVSVDVDALERSGLVASDDLNRVLDVLPMLRGREIHVGFQGVPGARNGRIALAEDLDITLGFLTFPIEDLAEKLGFSIAALSSKLEFEIDGYVVEAVRAEPGLLALDVRER